MHSCAVLLKEVKAGKRNVAAIGQGCSEMLIADVSTGSLGLTMAGRCAGVSR